MKKFSARFFVGKGWTKATSTYLNNEHKDISCKPADDWAIEFEFEASCRRAAMRRARSIAGSKRTRITLTELSEVP
jgi:hypothetical protein